MYMLCEAFFRVLSSVLIVVFSAFIAPTSAVDLMQTSKYASVVSHDVSCNFLSHCSSQVRVLQTWDVGRYFICSLTGWRAGAWLTSMGGWCAMRGDCPGWLKPCRHWVMLIVRCPAGHDLMPLKQHVNGMSHPAAPNTLHINCPHFVLTQSCGLFVDRGQVSSKAVSTILYHELESCFHNAN